jgi:hypothetical protein
MCKEAVVAKFKVLSIVQIFSANQYSTHVMKSIKIAPRTSEAQEQPCTTSLVSPIFRLKRGNETALSGWFRDKIRFYKDLYNH